MEVDASPERIQNSVPVSGGTIPLPVKVCESMESEEERMARQAKLPLWLKSATEARLSGRDQCASIAQGIRELHIKDGYAHLDFPKQKHKDHVVMELTRVRILPRVEETTVLDGILIAGVDRFIFRASNLIDTVIKHSDLERCFMRLGDIDMPPLLLFHLQHPVMVGANETMNIQFYLVPSDTNEDSDNIDKHAWNSSRNKDLKNFVHKVQEEPQSPESVLPIHFNELEQFEFSGDVHTGTSSFALTYGALVLLEEEIPSVVFLLRDIEIVNLACLQHEKIDMTVVFKDYERDVLEIRSIPLKFLTGIKHGLGNWGVKYYVNSASPDRSMLLKDIRQSPVDGVLRYGGFS